MNASIAIRDKIHKFVDKADDRILRIFEAIVDMEERDDPVVPESFYQELDKDREKHLKGEIFSYKWEEVKSRLIKN